MVNIENNNNNTNNNTMSSPNTVTDHKMIRLMLQHTVLIRGDSLQLDVSHIPKDNIIAKLSPVNVIDNIIVESNDIKRFKF